MELAIIAVWMLSWTLFIVWWELRRRDRKKRYKASTAQSCMAARRACRAKCLSSASSAKKANFPKEITDVVDSEEVDENEVDSSALSAETSTESVVETVTSKIENDREIEGKEDVAAGESHKPVEAETKVVSSPNGKKSGRARNEKKSNRAKVSRSSSQNRGQSQNRDDSLEEFRERERRRKEEQKKFEAMCEAEAKRMEEQAEVVKSLQKNAQLAFANEKKSALSATTPKLTSSTSLPEDITDGGREAKVCLLQRAGSDSTVGNGQRERKHGLSSVVSSKTQRKQHSNTWSGNQDDSASSHQRLSGNSVDDTSGLRQSRRNLNVSDKSQTTENRDFRINSRLSDNRPGGKGQRDWSCSASDEGLRVSVGPKSVEGDRCGSPSQYSSCGSSAMTDTDSDLSDSDYLLTASGGPGHRARSRKDLNGGDIISVFITTHVPEMSSRIASATCPIYVATSLTGKWDEMQMLPMTPSPSHPLIWNFALVVPSFVESFSYLYVAWNEFRNGWEYGPMQTAYRKKGASSIVMYDVLWFTKTTPEKNSIGKDIGDHSSIRHSLPAEAVGSAMEDPCRGYPEQDPVKTEGPNGPVDAFKTSFDSVPGLFSNGPTTRWSDSAPLRMPAGSMNLGHTSRSSFGGASRKSVGETTDFSAGKLSELLPSTDSSSSLWSSSLLLHTPKQPLGCVGESDDFNALEAERLVGGII